MPNMGYCRFRNTLDDLRDCYEHLDDEAGEDEGLGEEEAEAREQLIDLCKQIAKEKGDDE